MNGCAQQVLAPQINEATIRLLTRHGCEVVVAAGAGCCGALTHHLGQDAHDYARANILAWTKEIANGGLDAIVINASGCGTTVKDYGFMFRNDPELAEPARIVSSLTRDITELMSEIGLQAHVNPTGQRVAYHSACSLQHGQQIREQPKQLLKEAGFVVLDPPEGHLCCGSAGTYNLLQPEIARRLRDRKVANIGATSPDLIAAGNIGCLTQIASGTKVPVVHTVELLDWATGGPRPKASVGVVRRVGRDRHLCARQLRLALRLLHGSQIRLPHPLGLLVEQEGEEHIAAPARHARHLMENRSGEDDRSSGRGLEGSRAVLGKRNLAALEIRVEIDRDCEPAMRDRDPGVVAMGTEMAAGLGIVARDEVALDPGRAHLKRLLDLRADPSPDARPKIGDELSVGQMEIASAFPAVVEILD